VSNCGVYSVTIWDILFLLVTQANCFRLCDFDSRIFDLRAIAM